MELAQKLGVYAVYNTIPCAGLRDHRAGQFPMPLEQSRSPAAAPRPAFSTDPFEPR